MVISDTRGSSNSVAVCADDFVEVDSPPLKTNEYHPLKIDGWVRGKVLEFKMVPFQRIC